MKIRNIQEYIKQWSEVESLHLLGKDDEPFLSKLNGVETQIDAWIEGSASFANNAQEQLFYEFVQNAFDAEADSLMFFMNEKYLIILNNGLPFFTDKCSKKERDGQLYNFLAKGKSQKHNNKEKLGNFGQGSKLLYTLIADTGLQKSADLLISAIKEHKKGPYLISWANDEQLQNFLLDRQKWEWGAYDDWENSMLITKIMMSYYPIAPGVNEKLFSKEELSEVVKAIDTLVDPRRNLNRLKQGTALVVPLGNGQYERINNADNVKHVRERLGDFAAIQSDKTQNKKNRLKHIYVFGEEVSIRKVKSVFVNVPIGDKLVEYQFAFNPEFAQDGVVNFYMSLPIHETRYGLGFIIDSDNFEIDDSRQRIREKDKTEKVLKLVFESLKKRILEIRQRDTDLWEYIYECLLSSNIPDIEDCQYIKNIFNEILLSVISLYIRTSTSKFMSKEFIWHAKSNEMVSKIPLDKIGISKHWILDDDYKKLKNNHKINVESVNIVHVINEADQKKLISWIKNLSNTQYVDFIKLVLPYAKEIDIQKQVFRSNFGNVFSWEDLNSINNVYFPFREIDKQYFAIYPKVEYISETFFLVRNYSESDFWAIVYEKVNHNIKFFSEEFGGQSCACALLKAMCVFNKNVYFDKIRNIALLSNVRGERLAFRQMFITRPEDTILFDSFVVRQPIPTYVSEDWFESRSQLWNWLLRNNENIKTIVDWEKYADRYLNDIKTAYNTPGLSHQSAEKKLDLYLNKDGLITEAYKALQGASLLNDEEYEHFLCQFSSLRFIPTRFRNKLIESPYVLNQSINRLSLEDCLKDDTIFPLSFVPIIFKLKPTILKERYVKRGLDGYSLVSFKGRNYLDQGIDDDIRKVYDDMGYYAIPEEIVKYIGVDYLSNYAPNNKELLLEAIEQSQYRAYLLSLVDRADGEVKDEYFNSLELNVTSALSDTDIIWRVIKYAMDHLEWQDKVFDAIRYNSCGLPPSMQAVTVECNGISYNIYDLLDEVKESNETIENFLHKLPDPNRFRQTFYERERTEQKDPDDVYQAIPCDTELSVKQLEFCLDYAKETGDDYKFALKDEKDLWDALEMIYERRFVNFESYFVIPNYNSTIHVFADKSLLMEEEYLPVILDKWLREHTDASLLMSSLLTEETNLIAIRKAVMDNYDFSIIEVEDGELLARTIKWIGKWDIQYGSCAYKSIQNFISVIPNTWRDVPLLRFTGETIKISDEGNDEKFTPCLRLAEGVNNPLYLIEAYEVSKRCFVHQYEVSMKFRKWIKNQNICVVPQSDFLVDHKLNRNLRVEANQVALENKDTIEWDGVLYNEWKKSYPKCRILLSNLPIVIYFTIKCKEKILYEEQIGNQEFGYGRSIDNIESYVIVRNEKTTKQVIDNLKVCQNEESLVWFRPAYIELQDLLINMIQEKQDVDEILSPNYSLGLRTFTASEHSRGNLYVSEDKLVAIKGLMEQLSAEELEVINERIDDIRKVLQVIDEDEPTSKVRAIIGYIGEQVYDRYLTKRGIEHEYVAEHEGEYDFKVKQGDDTIYVDVKTNLYSLEDGTAPFYIHKSQSAFMQQHPEAKFRIVRLSLKDIDIDTDYIRLKEVFGVEADPTTNIELQKRCQKIADNYWQGASIEIFDAKSPEYGLSITKFKS